MSVGNLPKKQTQEPLETISPIYHVSPREILNLILDKKTVFFFSCKPNKFRVLWSGNPVAQSPNCLQGWKQTSPTVTQHCGKQACYTGFNCVYLRVYLFCGAEDGPWCLVHTKRTCSACVREQMLRLRKVSFARPASPFQHVGTWTETEVVRVSSEHLLPVKPLTSLWGMVPLGDSHAAFHRSRKVSQQWWRKVIG